MRRCRYRPPGPDPYDADLVRRLRALLALVRRPAERGPDAVQRDDDLLNRL
ncbi:hypothetical protein ACIA58_22525 [Kribbella sp. NPDC051586]|uniref:hypothetical protein n=1 Tax=Kribbella sp. NPDC051586 TaxID=3364118 RepID=UPI00379C3227